MKLILIMKLFTAVMLLTAAGWLWVSYQSSAIRHTEDTIAENLRTIVELDREIIEQLALAQAGQLANYDALGTAVNGIEKLLEQLNTLSYTCEADAGATLQQQIAELHTLFIQKKSLIENFKSSVTVSINSIRFLPLLILESSARIRSDNNESDPHQPYKQLMQLASSRYQNDIDNWHNSTTKLVSTLEQSHPEGQHHLIRKHLDMVHHSQSQAALQLEEIKILGFHHQLKQLSQNFLHTIMDSRNQSEKIRFILQLVVLALLLLTSIILLRLIAQRKKLHEDNQERTRINDSLRSLTALNHQSINEYLENCVKDIAKTGRFDLVSAAFFDDEQKQQLKTAVFFKDGKLQENITYPIKGTPCEQVQQDSFCIYQNNVAELFPEDEFLSHSNMQSYCGLALYDRYDQAIGVLTVLHRKPLELSEHIISLIRVYASRISIELERNNNLKSLSREKSQAVQTLNAITDGVIATDEKGSVRSINPAAAEMLGIDDPSSFTGLPAKRLGKIIEGSHASNPIAHCIETGEPLHTDKHAKLITNKGGELDVDLSAAPIYDDDHKISGVILVLHDASQERKFQSELAYHASHDGLTGLLNRRALEEKFQKLLGQQDKNCSHSLLFIDLDRFKVINDSCGHTAGDELLRKMAELLQKQVRETDTLARLGGDEFFVLLPHCPSEQAKIIAEKIREQLAIFRFFWEGKGFSISASIGLITIDTHQYSFSELISMVDIACLNAKQSGRNKVVISNPGDSDFSRNKGEALWIPRLEQAITHNAFQLYQQVIKPVNHAIVCREQGYHCEILLRLRDEEGNRVMPSQFIPPAERYDMMGKIDRWVIHQVIIRMSGVVPGTPLENATLVSINLSGQSLGDENLLPFIRAKMKRYGLDPGRLCFEVTETNAISNYDTAIHLMKELHHDGCRFALDDFGSGLTSYSYIKNLPADFVKIDREFTVDLANDSVNRAIVNSIIDVARSVKMMSIAEGVEDEETQAILEMLGIDYVQGYGLGHPEPVDLSEKRAVEEELARQ